MAAEYSKVSQGRSLISSSGCIVIQEHRYSPPTASLILFEIFAGVLQGDTLAPYLFIIVLDYCLRTALERHPDIGFTLKPARSRRVGAERVTDTDFADDVALLANSVEDLGVIMTHEGGRECL